MDFGRLTFEYFTVIFEFLIELYVCYFLFQLGLKRKRYYYPRLLVGFAAVAVAAFGLSFFYYYFGDTVWGRTLVYLSLFAVSVTHIKLCYAEGVWSVMFCCVSAYAAQNLAYKLQLILWYGIGGWENFPTPFGTSQFGMELFYRLYYYTVIAVIYVLIYLVFVRRIKTRLNLNSAKWNILIISIFLLLVTVLLCTIEDIYASEQSFILRQSSNMMSVICCSCILLLLSALLEKKSLTTEIEFLQHTMKSKEEQYKISKETIDVINIKCHDMRHRLDLLREQGGKVSSKEFEELEEAISIYDANIRTGNETLDVILTDKNLFCEKHGIYFSCMVDGKNLSFMSESDIYGLFGNIVENAIEAVLPLSDKDQRTVNLIVKTKANLLIIQSENFFEGDMQFVGGVPVTTKKDKHYHGFGLKSIKLIVHKYGGEVSLWADGNIFRLSIIFPLA